MRIFSSRYGDIAARACTGAAMVAIAASAAPVAAQSASTEASASAGEIIVTARRTDEKLQDVPVAVAAFGADALEERGIKTELDLQTATPGLTVRNTISSNQVNYAIRGQSVDAFSFSAPAIASYFNEVPVGGTSGTALFDLESIQVLKGPQGTLFGRNTTGGAVLYSSHKPELDFGGYLKGGFGNFDNVEVEGALNLPITSGVALRISGRSQDRDGYQHNLLDGSRPNSIDAKIGRISLLIEPEGSRFSNLTVMQKGKYKGRNGALSQQNSYGANGAPTTYVDPVDGLTKPLVTIMTDVHAPDALGPGAGSSLDPRVNALFNGMEDYLIKREAGLAGGFYDVYINRSDKHDAEQTFLSNTTSYELTDAMTVKNIFGYNKLISEDFLDVDGGPYEFFGAVGGPPQRVWGQSFTGDAYIFGTKQWSDELQVNGEAGRLKYIFGGFISEEKTWFYVPVTVFPDLGLPYVGSYDSEITDKSKALYAQASYALTDRLNISGGFRYTWEKVSVRTEGSEPGDPKLLDGLIPTSAKVSKPSWLVGLDYKISNELLIYFNHRGSFRTGGFNGASGAKYPLPDYFKPETTYDFELGAKFAGRLGSMPASFNIAIYDQYIKNVQRTVYLDNAALAGNADKARVTGLELDGHLGLTDWFDVGGAFAYTHARFTSPSAVVGNLEFTFGPYADAPKYTGSAYGRISTELGNAGELALRGEVYAQSSFYYSNLNDTLLPLTKIGGYSVINMRAEWNEMLGSRVSAAAYVNNLGKEKYYVGGIALGQLSGTNATLPGAPRMYGMEIKVEF